jgi:hypothetical protein
MSLLQTLWDLIAPPKPARRPARPRVRNAQPRVAARPKPERYDHVAREMLGRYGVRVRRWRRSMSGIAWELRYRDGRVTRLIEAPRPRGPVSAAVFLHEIGHHAIGFDRYELRCLEEYHAWAFSLAQMERLGLPITPAVHKLVGEALRYAVAKARRRGLRQIPDELTRYA